MIDPLEVLKLVGGVIYLFMGGDLLVRGSISIARSMRFSPVVIGANGRRARETSLPELIVSILAVSSGHSEIALGNVVGSNVTNVLIVLGVPALIAPVAMNHPAIRGHCAFMAIASVLFVALCFLGPLTAWHGLVLLGALALAASLSLGGWFSVLDLSAKDEAFERVLGLPGSFGFAWFFVVFGVVVMPVGANLTIGAAARLAADAGISEAVIAESVVAFGTSLPELSATIVAALHRQMGLAVGNVIGSNAFNIMLVMGATAVVGTVAVPENFLYFDLWFMLACAGLLTALAFARVAIGRSFGAGLVVAYLWYLWIIF